LGRIKNIQIILFASAMALILTFSSCATQKPGLPVKQKRKKNCDCPDWSQHDKLITNSKQVFFNS